MVTLRQEKQTKISSRAIVFFFLFTIIGLLVVDIQLNDLTRQRDLGQTYQAWLYEVIDVSDRFIVEAKRYYAEFFP